MKNIYIILVLITCFGLYKLFFKKHRTKNESLQVCKEWYVQSFNGWNDHWPNLAADKKNELIALSTSIDRTVTSACDCLYSKSHVFRDDLMSKFYVDETESFMDAAIAETKIYKSECTVPNYFTWKGKLDHDSNGNAVLKLIE